VAETTPLASGKNDTKNNAAKSTYPLEHTVGLLKTALGGVGIEVRDKKKRTILKNGEHHCTLVKANGRKNLAKKRLVDCDVLTKVMANKGICKGKK
jgi:hypothetical protein